MKTPKSRRWLPSFRLIFRLGLVAAVVLVFYAIYLDGQLTHRFSTARYQAPALLYSQALEINAQQPITRERIIKELQALDYQVSRYARNSGEYQAQGQQLLLNTRAFSFPTHFAQSQRVRLLFDEEGWLERVESWPGQEPLDSLQLEPQILGRFSTDSHEDRLLVGLERVPVLMRETLLLVEDREFYHHHGVRPTAIARAAVANLMAGRAVQGGSTITQQLVKNMYLSHDKTYVRKANEAIMALILDYRFSKDEILEAYFNEVFFGQDRGNAIHGVALASQFYFGEFVEDLSVAEIATLIGMIKGPSYYEPRRNPERAQQRRDVVLRLMFEHDLISQTQYLAAVESPVRTRAEKRLARFNRPDFIDLVQQEVRSILPDRSWQETGLRVFTTFDPEQQRALEQAARNSNSVQQLADNERAMVLTEHRSGAVRALVGGAQPVLGGFNRAITARRQVGSLAKPWVYAIALEQAERYSLASMLDDSPVTIQDKHGEDWTPRNFDNKFRGYTSLYQSLVHSLNIPVVRLGMELTPEYIRSRLLPAAGDARIPPWPSILLGAMDFTPLEVARVYGALAAEGIAHKPYAVNAITTHRGDLLYQHMAEPVQLFTKEAAWLTSFALEGAIRTGTGRGLAHLGPGLAGKTGSTNDLRDSWFVSYDANYVLTTWLGHDDNSPVGLTGSRGALPLAGAYWQVAGVAPRSPFLPQQMHWAYIDQTRGVRVGAQCEHAIRLPIWGEAPEATYDCQGEPLPEHHETEQPKDEKKKSWWQRLFGA
ncbi:penicillin-binding protein 1B [Aliidiomarina taiwanensis]|uniref:Penicillin-binding protein 1B n=1 Tax=Aliidiomarina taiwanensis TaxID=946228 RepID=A0A432X1A8_9GAMM|nr:penicillin-binding protein 1B [Aliidiomarina taiwanensis]RUO40048.1 penicillin-binding protein 1B [Aliidiomarina taiwanensis]